MSALIFQIWQGQAKETANGDNLILFSHSSSPVNVPHLRARLMAFWKLESPPPYGGPTRTPERLDSCLVSLLAGRRLRFTQHVRNCPASDSVFCGMLLRTGWQVRVRVSEINLVGFLRNGSMITGADPAVFAITMETVLLVGRVDEMRHAILRNVNRVYLRL